MIHHSAKKHRHSSIHAGMTGLIVQYLKNEYFAWSDTALPITRKIGKTAASLIFRLIKCGVCMIHETFRGVAV